MVKGTAFTNHRKEESILLPKGTGLADCTEVYVIPVEKVTEFIPKEDGTCDLRRLWRMLDEGKRVRVLVIEEER